MAILFGRKKSLTSTQIENIEYSMDTIYRPKDVFAITNETRQRVQYWYIQDLITPYDEGRGIGTSRLYSFSNLIEISVIQYLWSIFPNHLAFVRYVMDRIQQDNPAFFKTSIEDPQYGDNVLVIRISDESEPKRISAWLRCPEEAEELKRTGDEAGDTVISKRLDLIRTNLNRRIDEWRGVT